MKAAEVSAVRRKLAALKRQPTPDSSSEDSRKRRRSASSSPEERKKPRASPEYDIPAKPQHQAHTRGDSRRSDKGNSKNANRRRQGNDRAVSVDNGKPRHHSSRYSRRDDDTDDEHYSRRHDSSSRQYARSPDAGKSSRHTTRPSSHHSSSRRRHRSSSPDRSGSKYHRHERHERRTDESSRALRSGTHARHDRNREDHAGGSSRHHHSSRSERHCSRDRHDSYLADHQDQESTRHSNQTRTVAKGHSSNGRAAAKQASERQATDAANAKKAEDRLLRLIPGYADMSAAQQLKARTRAMLQQNRQQGGSAAGEPWTRYVFSQVPSPQCGPLDDVLGWHGRSLGGPCSMSLWLLHLHTLCSWSKISKPPSSTFSRRPYWLSTLACCHASRVSGGYLWAQNDCEPSSRSHVPSYEDIYDALNSDESALSLQQACSQMASIVGKGNCHMLCVMHLLLAARDAGLCGPLSF